MERQTYDLVIIGGGPAGLTSGIYAQRAGLKTLLLEKEIPGGQVNEAPSIENYPGFIEISGMELANKMKEHAASLDLPIENEAVQEIIDNGSLKLIRTTGEDISSKAIIIATGAKPRRLRIKGEEEFLGRGVSYCATCDGPLFRGKVVAAVGGGDRAIKEALYLSNIVRKVYIIHRRAEFRAEKVNVERLSKRENVEYVLDSVVEEIKGEGLVNSLVVKNVKEGTISELPVNGAFVFVGIIPRNDFVDAEKDSHGFLVTGADLETSIKGIFAVGDCRSKNLRQVATAVGEGAQAVASVEEYLHN